MMTADSMVKPLDRPKAVDRVTIEIPAAPCNAHVSQRSQKLFVRTLSPTVKESLKPADGFSWGSDSGLCNPILSGISVNWAAAIPTTKAMIARRTFREI